MEIHANEAVDCVLDVLADWQGGFALLRRFGSLDQFKGLFVLLTSFQYYFLSLFIIGCEKPQQRRRLGLVTEACASLKLNPHSEVRVGAERTVWDEILVIIFVVLLLCTIFGAHDVPATKSEGTEQKL